MKIGVLALQGAFREHCRMLERCNVQACEIRTPAELCEINGLIIPGGESTTIGKLMIEWNLLPAIKEQYQKGMPSYGTCAGMILLCNDIADSNQPRLGLLDARVRRNGFGRQRESFEAMLDVPEFGEKPLAAVFIRAPYIEHCGPGVSILACVNEKIVIARQGKILVTAFHPELTDDDRVHRYFLRMAAGEA